MLKINAIKIEVNTNDGLYGNEIKFDKGLNIVRGDNSSGKSSLFQSIIYGLGFEELLGGKNEKTMQSALKDQVEFPKDTFHQVLQSFIYLEIENETIITIRRGVTTENRKSQLVDVYDGALLTGNNQALVSRPMYIHDKGGATDEIYGFHLYLADFLKWALPETVNKDGDLTKLYLQQIAPAFIIEQKSGWSDFFATMPYYAMRNTESRVVEFLLSLNVFENEQKKRSNNYDKQNLLTKWNSLFSQFLQLTRKVGGNFRGLENTPRIVNTTGDIFIAIEEDGKELSLVDYNEQLKHSLNLMSEVQVSTVGSNIQQNEIEFRKLIDKLNQLTLNYELLSPEINFDTEKLKQYSTQLEAVQEDLRKNRGALKVKSLGFDLPAETASNLCPTCHQEINDSLLPLEIDQPTMRLEDNISYIEAQQKMIEVYSEGQKRKIQEKRQKLDDYERKIMDVRQSIRGLKQELIQDERLPSILEIEKRLNLRKKIEFFTKNIEEFNLLLERLRFLSSEYETILEEESGLPRDFFSTTDREKLTYLQNYFISLIRKFNYQSKPFEAIRISLENYLPVAQKISGENLYYNIKFDSSASDFIRCIWAYFTSILKTAVNFDTNHPRLLMLDEPKQQDMSIENFRAFLQELSKFKDQQIIVFASFENSDEAFEEATRDVEFSLKRIENKLIMPI
ncbi:AAA family ATPase [Pedobacter sp.]|uniref:ATP-binding protein n=1 Tax=Pedobacter sp. TaxID=1411316 RepID=UPI003D7FEDE4